MATQMINAKQSDSSLRRPGPRPSMTRCVMGGNVLTQPACLLLWGLLWIIGCQPPQSDSMPDVADGDPNRPLQIAVIPKGTTHEFWKSVHYGAEQAAKELGVKVLWQGPLLENDREGQINVVQGFITKGVDGICLAPLDSQALVASVKEAGAADIPVVIFDSGLDDESLIVSYVATDNRRGGALAAEEMAKRLNGKGKVVMLRYTPGSESTHQREEGFLEKIASYPDIEVISKNEYSGTTPESSLDKAQQILNKFRDEVDGIFAVCEPNATGVLEALENNELASKVVFIGFDPTDRMVKALADQKMQGIVLQDPVTMGYEAVVAMVKKLRGEEVASRITTGEYIATPENMNDEKMRKLLSPPQFD